MNEGIRAGWHGERDSSQKKGTCVDRDSLGFGGVLTTLMLNWPHGLCRCEQDEHTDPGGGTAGDSEEV